MWNEIKVLTDSEKLVSKYVFTSDEVAVESVLYKYPTYEDRTVICCSTQSGCPIGCRFCGSGDYFVRSLTTDEIVSQPVKLIEDTQINANDMKRLQIMFMSMGEPLLNLKNLIPALHQLYAKYPKAALLISTSAPKVDLTPLFKVSQEIPTIGLQFSVHESTDENRNKLIPFANKMTLQEIARAGDEFFVACGRTPFFNYCVHAENGSEEDADRLSALFDCRHWQATISVICERDETLAGANGMKH